MSQVMGGSRKCQRQVGSITCPQQNQIAHAASCPPLHEAQRWRVASFATMRTSNLCPLTSPHPTHRPLPAPRRLRTSVINSQRDKKRGPFCNGPQRYSKLREWLVASTSNVGIRLVLNELRSSVGWGDDRTADVAACLRRSGVDRRSAELVAVSIGLLVVRPDQG